MRGHVVDNQLAVVDFASGPPASVTLVELNAHVDRSSDPASSANSSYRARIKSTMSLLSLLGMELRVRFRERISGSDCNDSVGKYVRLGV